MRLWNLTCYNQVLRNRTKEEEDKELGGAIEEGKEKNQRESKIKVFTVSKELRTIPSI